MFSFFENGRQDLWRLYRGCSPLPIPNREVKPHRANGTGVKSGRVGCCQSFKSPFLTVGAFVFIFLSDKMETEELQTSSVCGDSAFHRSKKLAIEIFSVHIYFFFLFIISFCFSFTKNFDRERVVFRFF